MQSYSVKLDALRHSMLFFHIFTVKKVCKKTDITA